MPIHIFKSQQIQKIYSVSLSTQNSQKVSKRYVVEVKSQTFLQLVDFVMEKNPDYQFVQDKNVKIYADSRAGPFNITDLSEICDFSDVVLDLSKGLE